MSDSQSSWTRACNRCKATGLQWKQIEGRWKLYMGDVPHECRPVRTAKPATPQEFWSKGAFLLPAKAIDSPPADALFNFMHAWWNWVDAGSGLMTKPKAARQKAEQMQFKVMVP